MKNKYETIIGLEIHAELKTNSKMFCACKNSAEDKPNQNTCPICLGHPGTLPAVNKEAVKLTLLAGLALNCKINLQSKFDRKNYFYPDLPKGYQISQYDLPLCYSGYLEVNGNKIEITRIHLEEDTGKLMHPEGSSESMIDFNRAGAPLMEMVSEPVITTSKEAKKFCQNYQQILKYLDISNANMEKGEMRCEANISVQKKDAWIYENGVIKAKKGEKLNNKVEVKNLNSFKTVEKAIEYEIKRQTKALEKGEEIKPETRGWNEKESKTVAQRVKETSADYRYFPEPDIPPLEISKTWLEELKAGICELPEQKIKRFQKQYGLERELSEVIIYDKATAHWLEQVISELRAWIEVIGDDWERQNRKLSKIAANTLTSGLFQFLKKDKKDIADIKITTENFAELISLLYKEKINKITANKILKIMYKQGGDPSDIMKENNWQQEDNSDKLQEVIKEIIKNHPKQAEEYKQGKEALLKFFIGQVMAKTKGKANPTKVQKIIKQELN
jgi:aspartyl-tRNA(Asn)/glutamyl-tRNA(Gln) amidotransferase subunit B